VNRVKNYLEETNVQLGATYNVAKQSTESYDKGQAAAAKFMGAEDDEVGTQPLYQRSQSNVPNILLIVMLMTVAQCSNRPFNNPTLLQPLPNSQSPPSLRIHPLLPRPRSQYLRLGPSRGFPKPQNNLVARHPHLQKRPTTHISQAYGREPTAVVEREDSVRKLHAYEQCVGDYS